MTRLGTTDEHNELDQGTEDHQKFHEAAADHSPCDVVRQLAISALGRACQCWHLH